MKNTIEKNNSKKRNKREEKYYQEQKKNIDQKILDVVYSREKNIKCINLECECTDSLKNKIVKLDANKLTLEQISELLSLKDFPKDRLPILLNDDELFLEIMNLCDRFLVESRCVSILSDVINFSDTNMIPIIYRNATMTLLKLRECINEICHRNMIDDELMNIYNVSKDKETT